MANLFLLLSAVNGFCGVAMGAFGAHGLRSVLDPRMMAVYQTAVSYQMWHALGLGIIALLMHRTGNSRLLCWAGWLMFGGMVIFSGSLYILSIAGIRWLGAITPIGGSAFLLAWLLLAVFSYQSHKRY